MIPSSERIREILIKYFSDEDITALCTDYFRDVADNFATGLTKGQKIQLLIEHVERRNRTTYLLAALQNKRPEQYKDWFPDNEIHIRTTARRTTQASVRDPKRIFISHAHQDSEFAHRLAKDLANNGWKIWIAPDSIRPGEQWVTAIERGLRESGVFIAVLTPEAVASTWVSTETNIAIDFEHRGSMRVIPVELESCQVLPFLSTYQFISIRNHYEDGLGNLLDQLSDTRKSADTDNSRGADSASHAGQTVDSQSSLVLNTLSSASSQPPYTTDYRPRKAVDLDVAYTLAEHKGEVRGVDFSPDGTRLVCASRNEVILWQIGKKVAQLLRLSMRDTIGAVAFSPDGQRLVGGCKDGTVRTWDVATGQIIRDVRGGSRDVLAVAVAPNMLAAGYANSKIYLRRIEPTTQVILDGHQSKVQTLAFAPKFDSLASGSADGTARLWQIQGDTPYDLEAPLHRTWNVNQGEIYSVTFSPDGTLLAGGADNLVRIWRISSGLVLHDLESNTELKVQGVAFSPDGRYLAVGLDTAKIHLFRVSDWSECCVGQGHRAGINVVAFSKDGNLVASASDDGTVRVWKVPNL